MRYKEFAGSRAQKIIDLIDEIISEGQTTSASTRADPAPDGIERLNEARTIVRVNNREVLAIDDPHHDKQQLHAHLDNGRAVNKDGTRSHGGKPFRLTKDQAAALLAHDFGIAKSRLVEGVEDTISIELEPDLLTLLVELRLWLD